MQSKDYLRQAYRLDELIDSNKLELAELNELKTNIASTDYSKDRVQTSCDNEAAFAKIIEKIIELERIIDSDTEKLISLKIDIRKTIDCIEDNEEKLLLRLRYLNFLHWEEVCDRMDISLRKAHRLHDKGLEDVKKILRMAQFGISCY